jgi:hypothetical protein
LHDVVLQKQRAPLTYLLSLKGVLTRFKGRGKMRIIVKITIEYLSILKA